jgi:hypothetical protein
MEEHGPEIGDKIRNAEQQKSVVGTQQTVSLDYCSGWNHASQKATIDASILA